MDYDTLRDMYEPGDPKLYSLLDMDERLYGNIYLKATPEGFEHIDPSEVEGGQA